jgi:hypothetical protein
VLSTPTDDPTVSIKKKLQRIQRYYMLYFLHVTYDERWELDGSISDYFKYLGQLSVFGYIGYKI